MLTKKYAFRVFLAMLILVGRMLLITFWDANNLSDVTQIIFVIATYASVFIVVELMTS